MEITVNFKPQPSPGYQPRKALKLYNVESVEDAGVGMVKVKMQFSDGTTTYDHVVSVSVIPEKPE